MNDRLKPAGRPSEPCFKYRDGRLKGVHIKRILESLQETEKYTGQQEVIFAAFTYWLTTPRKLKAEPKDNFPHGQRPPRSTPGLRAAIALSCLRALGKAERLQREKASSSYAKTPRNHAIIAQLARSSAALDTADLYTNVLIPLGGFEGIAKELSNRVGPSNKQIDEIKYLLAIADTFHHRHLASKSKALYLLTPKRANTCWSMFVNNSSARNSITPVKGRQFDEYWGHFRKPLPFLYAANGIEVKPGKTLLTYLTNSRLVWKVAKPVFSEWMGRARYTSDTLMEKIWFKDKFDFPNTILPLKFDVARFKPSLAACLEKELAGQ